MQMLKRRIGRVLLMVVAATAVAGAALAYYTTSGSSTADASVGTLTAATISAPATSGASITITWTGQATLSNASLNSGIAYTVQRKLGAGSYAPVASGPCSGSIPFGTSSCTDTVGANGTYTYRVIAAFHSWTATSNEVSVVANVDSTPPTTMITFPVSGMSYNAAGFANQCASGTVTGICGTASDPSGVTNVKVAIQNSGLQYWSGSAFVNSATPIFIGASGTTSWSYAFTPPADDTYKVLVQATDGVGNTTAPGTETTATFTYDTVAPAVTLTKANGAAQAFPYYTNQNVTTIGGACGTAVGDNPTVSWSVAGGATESGTTTCSSGAWTATLTTALSAAGSYTVFATQSDAAGNTGSSGSKSIVIDLTAPSVTVTAPASGSFTNTQTPTLSGTAGTQAADATHSADSGTVTVKVFAGATTAGALQETVSATVGGGGNWSVPATTLTPNAQYTVQATQTDAAGNTGTSNANTFVIDTVAPAVTLTSPANGATGVSVTPTFTGTAGQLTANTTRSADSTTVTVYVCSGTQSSCNAASVTLAQTLTTTESGGNWSVTASQDLFTGSYTAQAAQSDGAGNTGTSAVHTFSTTVTLSQTTPGTYTLTVAPHVTSFQFTFKAAGGGGGGNTGRNGAAGGLVSGTITIPDSATQTQFTVVIGGGGGGGSNNNGGSGGPGCAAGGAGGGGTASADGGGGGGGATCIYLKGSPAGTIVAVGGGGGGAGGSSAGGTGGIGGGGPSTNPGSNCGTACNGAAGGGTETAGGGGTTTTSGGFPFTVSNSGGAAGNGGSAGVGGTCSAGVCGAGGVGGDGGSKGFGGGGGGGGYASGGGGGGGGTNPGGGGGGGSAYTGGAQISGGNYTVSVTTATNGGGGAGGAGSSGSGGGTPGTAGSFTFTGAGLIDPPDDYVPPTTTTDTTTTDTTTTDTTATDTTTTTGTTTTAMASAGSATTTQGLSTGRELLFFAVLGGSLLGFVALMTMPIPRRRRARRRRER